MTAAARARALRSERAAQEKRDWIERELAKAPPELSQQQQRRLADILLHPAQTTRTA